MENVKIQKKHVIIAAVVILWTIIAVALLVQYRPTQVQARSAETPVQMCGVGTDDVSLIVDGVVYPAETISCAKDRVVYSNGEAAIVHDGVEYTVSFNSWATQGGGSHIVEFNLEDAIGEGAEAASQLHPDDCKVFVIAGTPAE